MEVPLDEAARGAPPSARSGGERRRSLGGYYDDLARCTAWLRAFGYGGGRPALTVHRALRDPSAGGRTTVTRLHDVLLASLPLPLTGRVLDAGCGFGGTMLACAKRSTARFTGLTLSERQAAIGRAAIARAGLDERVNIEVADYDDPPPGPFDLVVAIESLAHSPHPAATLATWAGRLAPGGLLAVIDDAPEPAARGTPELAAFQAGWRVPALLDGSELRAILRGLGLAIVTDVDLSHELAPRSLPQITRLERLNGALRRCLPTTALQELLDSYRGGLALEKLYRYELMAYRLFVARKPA